LVDLGVKFQRKNLCILRVRVTRFKVRVSGRVRFRVKRYVLPDGTRYRVRVVVMNRLGGASLWWTCA